MRWISRRKFLKFGGLLGLAFGTLSLLPLGWGKTSDVTADMAEEDNRLAKKHHKSTSSGGKKVSQAQQQLKAAGFDPGPADGTWAQRLGQRSATIRQHTTCRRRADLIERRRNRSWLVLRSRRTVNAA